MVVVKVDEHRQLRLPCYNRLKDIPDNQVALTIGSSGLASKRFLEIMQQGTLPLSPSLSLFLARARKHASEHARMHTPGRSAASTLALESGTKIQFIFE